MKYVVSDIHGYSHTFQHLLKMIGFCEKDILYVLGDTIDRGPDPVGVLQFMSMHDNIIPIIGNHEYMMLKVLPVLLEEISDTAIGHVLNQEFLQCCKLWLDDGGNITANAFRNLSVEDREFLLEYVMDFSLYEQVEANGKPFLLIHSLPQDFHTSQHLRYTPEEIIFSRPDFTASWKGDMTYIIGHTPTFLISAQYDGKIFQNGNLIDIDCGCGAGRNLCAYCLDTGQPFYI